MFLRGRQRTGQDGAALFETIYPGWYPGRTVHVHAIVVRVVHAEKVVLIACRTPYPRTHADRLDGRLSQDPQHRVEMVDVLLAKIASGRVTASMSPSTARLSARSSYTASMTRSARPKPL